MTNDFSLMPEYPEGSEQAAEYLRMILPLITKFKTPANPINYSLYYEYVSGKDTCLQESIDTLAKKSEVLTPEKSLQLFKKHVLKGSAKRFEKVGTDLKTLVNQTLDDIKQVGEKASSHADQFEDQSALLAKIDDISKVKAIVAGIAEEAKHLAETSTELKVKLNDTNQEVEQLKKELEELKHTSETDPLTSLLNRRAFESVLENSLIEASETKSNLCLMMLDLDHFKRINDNFGHVIGDKVIRFAASILKQSLEEGQSAARYGGEEMVLLMPDVETTAAIEKANKIREALASHRLQRKNNGESIGQVTVSIGIGFYQQNDTMECLIDRADMALYKAKETGRNRVVAANHDQAVPA